MFSKFDVISDGQSHLALWPQGESLPGGFSKTGSSGSRSACLDHIKSELGSSGGGALAEPLHQVIADNSNIRSIAPAGAPLPDGWRTISSPQPLDNCASNLSSVWDGTSDLPQQLQNT